MPQRNAGEMETSVDNNLLTCVPVLQVRDARRSCQFYCDVLGFTKNWEHQFAPGLPLFVSVSRNSIQLFLTEHAESAFGTLIYFYVQDVDTLAQIVQAQGGILDLAPVDQPWGVRELHLRDLDGNKLRFGQLLDQTKP
jgi:uncharacterized glyoxalase superfamily protein PhnB